MHADTGVRACAGAASGNAGADHSNAGAVHSNVDPASVGAAIFSTAGAASGSGNPGAPNSYGNGIASGAANANRHGAAMEEIVLASMAQDAGARVRPQVQKQVGTQAHTIPTAKTSTAGTGGRSRGRLGKGHE
jgi:hypothetical protein